jgi:GNAT superfamily N-acetyltransferase
MSGSSSATQIRLATDSDLASIYALARDSLSHDAFSTDLLAEKLFQNPRPEAYLWQTWLARRADRPVGFMQSAARLDGARAWIGLFAVDPTCRRQGIARALFEHTRARWPAGTPEAEVLAIPGNYFAPGLDPRYTEALAFLERLGFERFKDCVNLTADLSTRFETTAEEQRLATLGVSVRRASPDDHALLDAYFTDHFGADWRFEAGLAMRNDPPSLHLAFKADELIAFSAHSTQNREWGFFGPMGTAPAARGLGIGRVLLWHCLNDMRDAGHKTSVIPWVGPIAFYQQWARCRVERVFWRYRLTHDR